MHVNLEDAHAAAERGGHERATALAALSMASSLERIASSLERVTDAPSLAGLVAGVERILESMEQARPG